MTLVLGILWWLAIVGTATSTIYCCMVLVGATRYALRKRREDRQPVTFLPPLSVLKPLHGTEPGLEENLRRFFQQDYPDYELLFCARREEDAGLMMARAVAASFPAIPVRFLTCGEPQFPNAKMWSLTAMAKAARHDLLVTSDADARISPDGLRRLVQAMADQGTGLSSCLYLGRTMGGFWAQLDAVGKSVEMSGGIFVADMLEGTNFALGVTMVLRRQSFEQAGGYEEVGQYYAEDFVLGNRLFEQGIGVRMSNYVVRLMVLPNGLKDSFNDQLRWMRSTRRSRPAGHLGTGLTYALPFGVLGLLWGLASGHPGTGLLWLLAMCVNRWIMAAIVLWALEDEQPSRSIAIYPMRDLLGWIVWVASYLGNKTNYHGGLYSLGKGGRFTVIKQVE